MFKKSKPDRHYVLFEHRSLVAAGIKGRLSRSLDELSTPLIKMDFETAPVKHEGERDFLALFMPDPPIVDLTLDRYPSTSASFVGYSLNKDRLLQTIDKSIEVTGFAPDSEPDPSFKATLTPLFRLEANIYNRCLLFTEIAKKTDPGIDLEKMFSTARYANFFSQYHNLSSDEAQERASNKYNK